MHRRVPEKQPVWKVGGAIDGRQDQVDFLWFMLNFNPKLMRSLRNSAAPI
jgi:hypothetical protein